MGYQSGEVPLPGSSGWGGGGGWIQTGLGAATLLSVGCLRC